MGVARVPEHRTFCRICPVLCGLVVETEGDQIVSVRGDAEHPISRGYTCPKGRAAGEFHHHPRRLDGPRLRGNPASWDDTLDDFAESLRGIVATHGPDAVAVYWGTWSWMDALGRLAADDLMRNLATRSRYSAITVDAIARLTVADLMGGTPALLPTIDHDEPGFTVLIGTNPVISHGHAGAMPDPLTTLRRLAAGPGLWVIDPRLTPSAKLANRYLAIRPGGDPALLAYVVRSLLDDGADHDYLSRHAIGVDELRRAVGPWDRATAARHSGVSEHDLDALVDALRHAKRFSIVTGTGTTMAAAGALTEWLAWSAQIVTGSFEADGGSWFNPGAISRADRVTNKRTALGRGAGPASRPDLASLFGEYPCAALADEIESGNVRALVVFGGDPLTSLPDAGRLERAFRQLDVLAVVDVVEAATVQAATHVLSVAGQFERDDLTYFTERFSPVIAAQRTAPVLSPAADRRTAEWVFRSSSERLGFAVKPDRLADLAAKHESLATVGAFVNDPPRIRGWVHDNVLPDGKWRLNPTDLVEQLAEYRGPADDAMVAIPRRAMRRMNSSMRDVARGGEDNEVWINPADAGALRDGDRVVIVNAVGSIEAPVRITDEIVSGAASIPHGFDDQNVNRLTSGAPGFMDPFTGMIRQSGIPVSIEPARRAVETEPGRLPHAL
jgi:anaerobic selenocysteine-containing dehydrogenase